MKLLSFMSQAQRLKNQAGRNCVPTAYNLNPLPFNISTASHHSCSFLLHRIKDLNGNRYQLLIILSHRSKSGLRVMSGKQVFPLFPQRAAFQVMEDNGYFEHCAAHTHSNPFRHSLGLPTHPTTRKD